MSLFMSQTVKQNRLLYLQQTALEGIACKKGAVDHILRHLFPAGKGRAGIEQGAGAGQLHSLLRNLKFSESLFVFFRPGIRADDVRIRHGLIRKNVPKGHSSA